MPSSINPDKIEFQFIKEGTRHPATYYFTAKGGKIRPSHIKLITLIKSVTIYCILCVFFEEEKNCEGKGTGHEACTIPGFKNPPTGITLPAGASYTVSSY